jgi:hypothetical protein
VAKARERTSAQRQPVETELKLTFPPEAANRLADHQAFKPHGASARRSERIVSTYFDTPSHELARRGLSWSVLKYDTNLGGYVVSLDKRQLERAPAYDVGEEPAWGDRAYESKIHDYYGVGPYWTLYRSVPQPAPAGFFLLLR